MKNKLKLATITTLIFIHAAPEAMAQTLIRYGAGFTRIAANQAGSQRNVRGAINAGLGNTNRALRDSRTNTRIIRGALEVYGRYIEGSRTVGAALADWRRRRGNIGRNGRNQTQIQHENGTRADFMMLIIRRNARGNNAEATPDTGYSCLKGNRERQPTFPHEIGHNLSGLHSHANRMVRSNRNQLPRNTYTLIGSGGRGFRDVANRYSNPNLRYRGATTGSRGNRENALRINRARVSRSRIRR